MDKELHESRLWPRLAAGTRFTQFLTHNYKHLSSTWEDQRSLLLSTRVRFSDSGPTLYLVQERAKLVLSGPNSTESNLFHRGETTYSVG